MEGRHSPAYRGDVHLHRGELLPRPNEKLKTNLKKIKTIFMEF